MNKTVKKVFMLIGLLVVIFIAWQLDYALYRMIGTAFMNMNITLSNKGTKFMSSEDKYSIYEAEDSLYDYEDEDYSVFTTEVGDIDEV